MLPPDLPADQEGEPAEGSAYVELPASLQELLTREAYLSRTVDRLRSALTIAESQSRSARKKTNVTQFFLSRETYSANRRSIETSEARLRELQQAIEQTSRQQQEVLTAIENELETFLRRTSPEYRKGLAAAQLVDDVRRCLDRFAEITRAFIRSLGVARNQMSAGFDRDSGNYRDSALDRIRDAIQAAEALEADIAFFNQIGSQYDETVRNSAFEETHLPRLEPHPYADQVRELPLLPIAEAQQRIISLLQQCEHMVAAGLHQKLSEVTAVESERQRQGRGFLHSFMRMLQDYAQESWVDESTLDAMVRQAARQTQPQPRDPTP